MKKLLAALVVILAFSIVSCGTQTENATANDSEEKQAAQNDRRARMQKALAEIKYDVPDEIDINYEVLDTIDTSASPLGVVPLPEELGKTLNGLFSKYTKHMAPNGKPIHIFAQSEVSDLQVVRCKGHSYVYRHRDQVFCDAPNFEGLRAQASGSLCHRISRGRLL
jgi:hypothetical protein